jgi:hypothetical protein
MFFYFGQGGLFQGAAAILFETFVSDVFRYHRVNSRECSKDAAGLELTQYNLVECWL